MAQQNVKRAAIIFNVAQCQAISLQKELNIPPFEVFFGSDSMLS